MDIEKGFVSFRRERVFVVSEASSSSVQEDFFWKVCLDATEDICFVASSETLDCFEIDVCTRLFPFRFSRLG